MKTLKTIATILAVFFIGAPIACAILCALAAYLLWIGEHIKDWFGL